LPSSPMRRSSTGSPRRIVSVTRSSRPVPQPQAAYTRFLHWRLPSDNLEIPVARIRGTEPAA
jgi:hypothetical protein